MINHWRGRSYWKFQNLSSYSFLYWLWTLSCSVDILAFLLIPIISKFFTGSSSSSIYFYPFFCRRGRKMDCQFDKKCEVRCQNWLSIGTCCHGYPNNFSLWTINRTNQSLILQKSDVAIKCWKEKESTRSTQLGNRRLLSYK